jgi:hypothetical protein
MTTKRLRLDGQPMRMLRWLRANPDSSSLEITSALSIPNVTGRVSDLRAAGYIVECRRRPDGVDAYRVVEPRVVTGGTQEAMFGG